MSPCYFIPIELMTPQSKISLEDLKELSESEIPFISHLNFEPVSLDPAKTVVRIRCDESTLRPGGTVAGPVMMALADAAFFVVIMANLGLVKLAVTTSLSFNFLRKPSPGDLYCEASILKLGKRLAVCEALLYTEELGRNQPVAHSTGTYSIPPT